LLRFRLRSLRGMGPPTRQKCRECCLESSTAVACYGGPIREDFFQGFKRGIYLSCQRYEVGRPPYLHGIFGHPQLRVPILESNADRIRVEVAQRLRVRIEAGDAHSVGEIVLPSPDRIDLRTSPLAPLVNRSLLEDDEAVVALLERPRDECTAAPREEHRHARKKRCRPLLPAT